MAEDALAKAMAPALPRLDVPALQEALAAASLVPTVDPKVISRAEAKLEQALKRQASLDPPPAPPLAEPPAPPTEPAAMLLPTAPAAPPAEPEADTAPAPLLSGLATPAPEPVLAGLATAAPTTLLRGLAIPSAKSDDQDEGGEDFVLPEVEPDWEGSSPRRGGGSGGVSAGGMTYDFERKRTPRSARASDLTLAAERERAIQLKEARERQRIARMERMGASDEGMAVRHARWSRDPNELRKTEFDDLERRITESHVLEFEDEDPEDGACLGAPPGRLPSVAPNVPREMSGFLLKKSGAFSGNKRRFFILQSGTLLWYKSEKDENPAGYCHLRDTKLTEGEVTAKYAEFVIRAGDRGPRTKEYVLQADDERGALVRSTAERGVRVRGQ